MIVVVSSRHMTVSGPLKEYAEQKAGKLVKYFDRIQEIEVVFNGDHENGKSHTTVEIKVTAEHKDTFVAHHYDGDAYACVDACVDKLERQLTDHKERIRNRKHPEEKSKKS